MGKRLIIQSRGHGSPTYRSPSHRHKGKIKIPGKEGTGKVVDIIHDPGHYAPVAVVKMEDGYEFHMLAPSGMHVGQDIHMGSMVPIELGSIMPLGEIPEGTSVYNIEIKPGDGGKLVRTPGTSALVISHGDKTVVQLPSKEFKALDNKCRAVLGIVSGGGRPDMPFAKAGKKKHAYQSRAKRSFKVSGVNMNPVDHPHGGGSHRHVGGPSSMARGTHPGRKVGRLAPKKRNRKKRRK